MPFGEDTNVRGSVSLVHDHSDVQIFEPQPRLANTSLIVQDLPEKLELEMMSVKEYGVKNLHS